MRIAERVFTEQLHLNIENQLDRYRMLERLLHDIEKPGRYIGSEINAYYKDFDAARVRFALAFPDVYEVGSSHLGLQILYHIINHMEGAMADRVYAPWPDFEKRLRALQAPLCTVESQRPLHEFDFIGFSLQYELSYTNILTTLDLGKVPLYAKDRRDEHPWVIAGGPCAFNPEPLADFLDFVVLGEAEQILHEIVSLHKEWRLSKGTREEFLREIRGVPGIYVPSFFDVSYGSGGIIENIQPRFPDYTHVDKRIVMDLGKDSPVPEKPLVPLLDIVHNRFGLEISRGCTRGCRFCQAGFIYRPVRERNPQELLTGAKEALRSSGFEELSLLSLSAGDYCQIQGLLQALTNHFEPQKVAVSLPSMRVGTLTPQLMEMVRRVRKTGFTLAPEAGSERLRRVINKDILDEDLLAAADNAFGLGWRLLKLYFMMGLPTETRADLDALIDLCHRVWRLAKPSRSSINISVSTFVPKPLTPFQWMPQLSMEAMKERLAYLKENLKRPGLRFKWNDPIQSVLEGVFARGDRRLGRVLLRAWELGARFDGWSEFLREDIWRRAFADAGLAPAFYTERERSREEILPWDHLSANITKGFLWGDLEKALGEEFVSDCRWSACTRCGACDHKTVQPVLFAHGPKVGPCEGEKVPQKNDEAECTYWFRYAKTGKVRFFGQLETAQIFGRAIRRAGLPAAHTKGFHPHIKLSFSEALPLGIESQVEEAYLTLKEHIPSRMVQSLLNSHLPPGLSIDRMAEASGRHSQTPSRRVSYRVSRLDSRVVGQIAASWSQRLSEIVVKKTKRGELKVPLGDILLDVRIGDETSLEMDIFEAQQVRFRPSLILQHLLGEAAEALSGCRICKTANTAFRPNRDTLDRGLTLRSSEPGAVSEQP